MKLQIKNLHGDTYDFEIEDNETVKSLKEMIGARDDLKEKYVPDLIKLLCAGNVMEDEEMLNTFTIKPDGFLVLVKQTPGKPKPPPKKKPTFGFGNMMNGSNQPFGMSQALSNSPFMDQSYMQSPFPQLFSPQASIPSTFPLQTQIPGMGTTDGLLNPAESSFTTNEDRELAIVQLESMGFDRPEAEKALRACGYSVEAAIDCLTLNNISLEDNYPLPPVATELMPTPTPASPTTQNTSIIQQKPPSSANIPSANSTGGGLNLQELGRMLEQHPEQLQTLKDRLKSDYPDVAELIEDDPEAFLDLVRQAADSEDPVDSNPDNTVGIGTAGSTNIQNSAPASPSLNAHELQSIKRIEDMGFDRARVIEAFLACDRNEEMAANYVLTFFDN